MSWKGFIPDRAVVMLRRSPAPGLPPLSPALDQGVLESQPAVQTLTAPEPVESAAPPASREREALNDSLERIAAELEGCPRCKLCKTRKTIVVGEGHPRAELVFVGEGPGEQEDLTGRPFVGAAGQLLDKMIVAMGLSREQVYIANVVKCRPPGNRNPEPDEIAACRPFLERQLAVLRPKVVVALGKFAAQTLLATDTPISRLRGQFRDIQLGGAPVRLMPTFHPSYLLRSPEFKREAWEDLKQVAKELAIQVSRG